MANDSLPAHDQNPYPYGFCPTCGCYGKARERRPNGNDTCVLGHTYPSRDALKERSTDLRVLISQRMAQFRHTMATIRSNGNYASNNYDLGYLAALEWSVDSMRTALDDSASHNDPQASETRLALLETEVRRLNNAIRHMRESFKRASQGDA